MAPLSVKMIVVQFATVDLAIAAERTLTEATCVYDSGLTWTRRSCTIRATPTTRSGLFDLIAVLNDFILAL